MKFGLSLNRTDAKEKKSNENVGLIIEHEISPLFNYVSANTVRQRSQQTLANAPQPSSRCNHGWVCRLACISLPRACMHSRGRVITLVFVYIFIYICVCVCVDKSQGLFIAKSVDISEISKNLENNLEVYCPLRIHNLNSPWVSISCLPLQLAALDRCMHACDMSL